MAQMTLAQARTQVYDYVNDDATRWSSTQVDAALKAALSYCQTSYCSLGGDRFDEIISTTYSSGEHALSSYDPLAIKGVSVKWGSTWHPISATDEEDRLILSTDSGDIRVRLQRSLAIPTTTSHPLVGVTSTEAGSIPAFDEWVCARGAQMLLARDYEAAQQLAEIESRFRDACLGMPRIPQARRFPRRAAPWAAAKRWSYDNRNKKILISCDFGS